jgi:hypothetical protein
MKVVLSHPFSGALHWWLAAQSSASAGQRSKRPSHGYYRTLYGDVDKNLDIALACSVIFEQIVLPAADAPYPQFERTEDETLHLGALEMETDWGVVREAMRLVEPIEGDLLHDEVIRTVLARVPADAQRMALLYATTDVLLAQIHLAPVICAPGRRKLVMRLLELEIAPLAADLSKAIDAAGGLVEELETWTGLVSLRFTSNTIQRLADVKWNGLIRDYSQNFQQALLSASATNVDRLFQDIAAAWDSAELATQVAGAFSATSRTMGPLGLLPGIGIAPGLVGMGADAAAMRYEQKAGKFRWYELGAEIQRYESLRALEEELRRRNLRP